MDINSMLEPREAFSTTPYPEYTHAQIDTYYAQYHVYPPAPYNTIPDNLAQLTPPKQQKFEDKIIKAAKFPHEDIFEFDTRRPTFGKQAAIKQAGSMYNGLKDAGAPTPPRWTGMLGVSRDKPSTDLKGGNLVQGDAPWVQDPRVSIKQGYNTAIIQPSGTKGLLVPPPYPISATERRDNGHTSFEASPKVHRMSPAERDHRAAQLIAVRRQELGLGIQNPMAGRNRARSSRFRELIDMQKGQAPFVNYLRNSKEGIIGNDRSVLDQYNTLLQRPTTPPLARFDVSGPPALLPRQGTTSTAMGQAPFVNLPPHLLEQQQMSQQPGDPRHEAAVRQTTLVHAPGFLLEQQRNGQQLESARARQRQYMQERFTAQQQQQANRASGPPSLRSSPEQTEPGGPQKSAVLAHQHAQHHHQMSVQQHSFMMQQFLAVGEREKYRISKNLLAVGQDAVVAQQAHQDPMKDNSNGLLASPSNVYPGWGFGRDSNMLPSPLTFQTPVDPNGPSFARDDSAERKRKTFDQGNIPVQPNDERCDPPCTSKNTRILCSVYRFPQGKVQSTISEDHTTNASKRRRLNFMALGQSKSYGATTKQHLRRDTEPNGRTRALSKV